jgi:hypothetical protein
LGLYKRILEELRKNKQLRENNQEIAIPFPFSRFSKFIPGIQKGRYYIISANQKVGKSKFTDFAFFYSPIEYILNNKSNLEVKILYFSLEMSKEEKMKELTCYILYKYYGYSASPEEISSVFKDNILPDNVLKILESDAFNNLMDSFEKRITFYDNVRNPFGIFKTVRDYAHKNGVYYGKDGSKLNTILIEQGNETEVKKIDFYQPNRPNEYVIVITDHVSLLTPEENHRGDIHSAMGEYSSRYCLAMRDRWQYIPVNIQQQASAMESTENFKLDKLQPSSNGLGDNKLTGRDCNVMLGLFAPYRHKIGKWEGYDITKLKDNHRELSVILNRHGPALTTQLYFKGNCGFFSELPPVELFNEKPELYNRFN